MSALILLRAKWRTLVNLKKSDRMGPLRLAALVVMGGLVWCALLGVCLWFLGRVVAIEPIGVVMLRKLIELVVLFLFSILTVSNLIAAFSTLLLADDLSTLFARPTPLNALFIARWVESGTYASWMTVTFASPFFLAAGFVMEASAGYYFTWVSALPVLATIPTSLAVIIAMLLGRIVSAQRTRQVLVVMATAVFTVLFVLFRQLQPERFVDPDQRASLLEALSQVQNKAPPWLPSTWASDALWARLSTFDETIGLPQVRLVLGALTLFFVAGWIFRATFRPAFSRAQQGHHRSGGVGLYRRATPRTLETIAQAFAARGGGDQPHQALARKDRRVFLRDTTQWTQILLIVALVAIYVVNFSYIRSAGHSGMIPRPGLHFINLSLGGFVAVAICVRFAFPAISLEGRAFWIVLRAPISMHEVLRAKWRSLALPLSALVAGLVAITSLWLGSGLLLTTLAIVTVVPLTTGLCGLALGLGARFPRFHINHAAQIATGLGGALYMFGGLALLLVIVLLAIGPTLGLCTWIEHGLVPSGLRLGAGISACIVGLGLPWVVGRIAIRVGAQHLETNGLNA